MLILNKSQKKNTTQFFIQKCLIHVQEKWIHFVQFHYVSVVI